MTMVEYGWTITRDIVNMFFILALVVIAFATILRIETYGMKALLPKLIIIALLINFSYLVCGIIIDASQVLADYFIGLISTGQPEGEKPDAGMAVLETLKVSNALKGTEGQTVPITERDPEMTMILNTAFSASIIAVTGFVLLIGAVLLFIRIGALWALIIIAPFAWFFSIFPDLKTHASRWWSEFLKWSFFAPIYVFFIYLILRLGKQAQTLTAITIGESPETLKSLGLTEMMSNWEILFYYVFLVILLFGAPTLAMSMGIKAAGTAQTLVKGGFRGAYRIGVKTPTKGLWRKFKRETAVGRAIEAIPKAWKLRREEKERKAFEPAIGRWRDRFNLIFGRKKTFHEQRARDLLVDSERADLRKQNLSQDALTDIAAAAKKTGDIPKFQAAVLELVNRADEEALFEHKKLGAKYNHITSPENMQKLIQDSIPDEKEAIRFAGKVGALAKLSNIPQYEGMVVYDPKKKELTWVAEDKIGEIGGLEAMKIHPQARWRSLNRRAYLTQNPDGSPGQITNTLKIMLRQLDTGDPERAQKEMPGLNKTYIVDGQSSIQAEIDKIKAENPEQGKIAQEWLDKIKQTVAPEKEEFPPEVTTA